MLTTVYISRHSELMKLNFCKSNDNLQFQNEKQILSLEGERRAKILSEIDELKHIDVVISSNYIRAMSTAKYIIEKNHKDFSDGKFFAPELFKLEFEDKNLTNIENIKIVY